MSLLQNLFGFDRDETPGEIVFFKIFELFVAGASIQLAWKWAAYIRRISDVVLPLGIAQYVDVSFLFGTWPSVANAVLITLLMAAGFLRWGRFSYLAGFFLLHFQYAARFVLGEIPHSANMLGMTLLGLALATAAFREPRLRGRFTLGFTYFFVGLGYTLAAFSKLVGTGLAWSDGRHLWMWIHEKGIDAFAKTGVLDFNMLQHLALSDRWFATAILTFGLITEFCAFLMWWRRFRYPVIFAVFALHVGIYVSMNIIFVLSMYELVLLGLPWAAWIDYALRRAPEAATERLHALSLRYA